MNDLSELYIISAKMVGYATLETYIYYYLHSNEIKKVDVLTFFTFTLAVLESAHCLFTISSNSITLLRNETLYNIKRMRLNSAL